MSLTSPSYHLSCQAADKAILAAAPSVPEGETKAKIQHQSKFDSFLSVLVSPSGTEGAVLSLFLAKILQIAHNLVGDMIGGGFRVAFGVNADYGFSVAAA